MNQKKRKTKKLANKKNNKSKSAFSFKRRSLFNLGLATILVVPAYAAISAYSKNQELQRDLSVIGQGIPTLIQVHDESCPKCRKLLSSTKAVIDEFPELEFKIADLKSKNGTKFALAHQASKVTLMYFDSRGKKIDVVSGLQTKDEVRSFIKRMHSN